MGGSRLWDTFGKIRNCGGRSQSSSHRGPRAPFQYLHHSRQGIPSSLSFFLFLSFFIILIVIFIGFFILLLLFIIAFLFVIASTANQYRQ